MLNSTKACEAKSVDSEKLNDSLLLHDKHTCTIGLASAWDCWMSHRVNIHTSSQWGILQPFTNCTKRYRNWREQRHQQVFEIQTAEVQLQESK